MFSLFALWHLFPSFSSSSLHHVSVNRRDTLGSVFTIEDIVAINAGTEQCRQHFIEMQSIIEKMYGGKLDVMTAMDAQQNLERRVMRFDPDKDTNIEANNLSVLNAMSSAMHDRCSSQGRTPPEHSSTAASSSAQPALALNLLAGKPLSMFDSLSWMYSFV